MASGKESTSKLHHTRLNVVSEQHGSALASVRHGRKKTNELGAARFVVYSSTFFWGAPFVATDFKCRMCGSGDARREITVREMMFGTRTVFQYVECSGCEGLQIDSIPDNLSEFYPDNYYSFSTRDGSITARARIGIFLRQLQRRAHRAGYDSFQKLLALRLGPIFIPKVLEKLEIPSTARILDVGCGAGSLLIELRDAGFVHPQGVDPFLPRSISYPGGVRVARASLSEMRGPFDLIMLHHVFEHLPDPLQTLRECRDLLSTDGQLLLRFPSVPCEAFDVYGTDWLALDAPRHLHIVSRVGLESMGHAAGLKITSWSQDSEAQQFWGSEQYLRDIPLFDKRSFTKDRSVLDPVRLREMEMKAEALNRAGRGDWSVAVLQIANP